MTSDRAQVSRRDMVALRHSIERLSQQVLPFNFICVGFQHGMNKLYRKMPCLIGGTSAAVSAHMLVYATSLLVQSCGWYPRVRAFVHQ